MIYRFYLNKLCAGDVVYTITKKGEGVWDKEKFEVIEGTSRHGTNHLKYYGKRTVKYYQTNVVFDSLGYSEAKLPSFNVYENSPPLVVGSGDSKRSIYRQKDQRGSDGREIISKIEIVDDKTKMTWRWMKNRNYFYTYPYIEDDDVEKITFTKVK